MKLKLLYLILPILFISCGGTKVATTAEAMAVKKVVKLHHSASPKFETLAGRIQLAYETADEGQSVTVSIRMEKDKAIWVKASLLGMVTLAKVLITPDSVQYYETIGKTYFDGDFSLLGEWLGTPINFQQTQDLLLGQSIFKLNASEYTSEIFQNKFKIQPKKQPYNFIHSLFLNPENFKIASETLSQPDFDRILNIRYGEYREVAGQYFPTEISIVSNEGQKQTKIDLVYKKIDLDVDISFPFRIPSGYERIQL